MFLTSFFGRLMAKFAFDVRSYLEEYFESIHETLLSFLHRKLSANNLTLLLSTLSSLFRYVAPLSSQEQSTKVYCKLLLTFRRCNPEIQRAGGEVWASVIRRVKGKDRVHLLTILVDNITEGDGVFEAWSSVAAAKASVYFMYHLIANC